MTPLSNRDLRLVWRKTAWLMLGQGHLADAREAWRNSRMTEPPERWRTGVRVTRVEEAVLARAEKRNRRRP